MIRGMVTNLKNWSILIEFCVTLLTVKGDNNLLWLITQSENVKTLKNQFYFQLLGATYWFLADS